METRYVATVDGKPAGFDGCQLTIGGGSRWHALSYSTLAEVRQLIDTTVQFRTQSGYGVDETRYGYVRIRESLIDRLVHRRGAKRR